MKKSILFAGLALFAVAACNKPPNVDPKPVDFSQYAVRVEPVITRAPRPISRRATRSVCPSSALRAIMPPTRS